MYRWLSAQGATFKPAKRSHLKVYLNGKQTVLAMHANDLPKGTERNIRKQLGLL